MKIFLLFMGLVAKEAFGIDVDTKAASTFENCNCQCDSTTWTNGQKILGNCRSQDKSGALFCYVSGRALCACRDVQCSKTIPNKQGNFQHFSYEACATPPRNKCNNYGWQQNFGDGDNLPYCSLNSYQKRCPRKNPVYSPPTRKPNYRPGGSSTNGACVFPFQFRGKTYRKCTTDGNKYGNTKAWCSTRVDHSGKHIGGGQGNWRNCPGGSNYGGGRNPPRSSGNNQNSGKPSLSNILSGIRPRDNIRGSSDDGSSGSVSFEA